MCMHHLMMYKDLIEHDNVGEVKVSLLCCIPSILKLRTVDIIKTGKYRPLLEKCIQIRHIDSKDARSLLMLLVLFWCSKKTSAILFYRRRCYNMVIVASRQVSIPLYSEIGPFHGESFGALAEVIGRSKTLCLREHPILAARHVGAYLFDFSAPDYAEVVSRWKRFKRDAEKVGGQSLCKRLGSGIMRWKGTLIGRKLADGRQSRTVLPAKSAKRTCRLRWNFMQTILSTSTNMSKNFRSFFFLAVQGKLGG